jgi:hypothetical protein
MTPHGSVFPGQLDDHAENVPAVLLNNGQVLIAGGNVSIPPARRQAHLHGVLITAAGASADVTVSATLSLGTILWSNPGGASANVSIAYYFSDTGEPTVVTKTPCWRPFGPAASLAYRGPEPRRMLFCASRVPSLSTRLRLVTDTLSALSIVDNYC